MGKSYAGLMFTPGVKQQQLMHGSRHHYERLENREAPEDRLSALEREFISTRDSFYMASITETGWPYLQHRGGPPGFVHVLDDQRIAFADLRGNRQYVSLANLLNDNRVFLFFMDYPRRARLKVAGHAEIHEGPGSESLLEQLAPAHQKVPAERAIIIRVAGVDWNCSQNITPRFTEEEVLTVIAPFRERLDALETENAELRKLVAEHLSPATK